MEKYYTGKPQAMEMYRHFKGGTYQIVCIAENSETGKEEVIYRAMYEPYKIYARDLDMFMSPVDREKYPAAKQQMRFELISTQASGQINQMDKAETAAKGNVEKDISEAEKTDADDQSINDSFQKKTENSSEKSEVASALIQFLEADTTDLQLKVLTDIREQLDERMITSIEFSLGLNEQKGSIDDRYRSLKHHIMIKQRYEKAHR